MRLNVVENSADSLLAALGGLISPVFAPLGFADWRASTALVTGFIAKESVVSTLTVLLGSASAITSLFTPLTAFALPDVRAALYAVRCRHRRGEKRARHEERLIVAAMQCGVAWMVAFIVRLAGMALGLG